MVAAPILEFAFRSGLFAIAFTVSALFAVPAAAETVAGMASVIDGDTIEIGGIRIRLHGIDAPESGQNCLDPEGGSYRCGEVAALALSGRIGHAIVRCEEQDIDRYGRLVAVCFRDGVDLNAWLVEQGHALAYRAYSHDYVLEEQRASEAMLGVWMGRFVEPWKWRRGERLDFPEASVADPAQDSPQDCLIKGNISRGGERIFHVPGQRNYDVTKISPSKDERWFCTEAEAQEEGWRPARQ